MLKEWYKKRTTGQLFDAKKQFIKDLNCPNIHLSETNIGLIYTNLDYIDQELHRRYING